MKAEISQKLSALIITIQHGLENSNLCNKIGKEMKGIYKEEYKNYL